MNRNESRGNFFDNEPGVIKEATKDLPFWKRRILIGYFYLGKTARDLGVDPGEANAILTSIITKLKRSAETTHRKKPILRLSEEKARQYARYTPEWTSGFIAPREADLPDERVVAEKKPGGEQPQIIKKAVEETTQGRVIYQEEQNTNAERGFVLVGEAVDHSNRHQRTRTKKAETTEEAPGVVEESEKRPTPKTESVRKRRNPFEKKIWRPGLLEEYLCALAQGEEFLLPYEKHPDGFNIGGILNEGLDLLNSANRFSQRQLVIAANTLHRKIQLRPVDNLQGAEQGVGKLVVNKGILPENMHRVIRILGAIFFSSEGLLEVEDVLKGDFLRIRIDQSRIEMIFRTKETKLIGRNEDTSMDQLWRSLIDDYTDKYDFLESRRLIRYLGDVRSPVIKRVPKHRPMARVILGQTNPT